MVEYAVSQGSDVWGRTILNQLYHGSLCSPPFEVFNYTMVSLCSPPFEVFNLGCWLKFYGFHAQNLTINFIIKFPVIAFVMMIISIAK